MLTQFIAFIADMMNLSFNVHIRQIENCNLKGYEEEGRIHLLAVSLDIYPPISTQLSRLESFAEQGLLV